MDDTVLQIDHLTAHYVKKKVAVQAVNDVSLTLKRGRILGIVGESGSGKSTLGLSILNLLPYPGKIVSGHIYLNGKDLTELNNSQMRSVRGRQVSMIFQDPLSGLNPVLPVATQIEELLSSHLDLSKAEMRQQVYEILRHVGLPDPERVAGYYPYQLSGGMAQRVMIGIATALNPQVVIADEPTSSLDVTIQAAILFDLQRLKQERGMSIILITHDLGVIAQVADDVAVMYAGSIVEIGPVRTIFGTPRHPYTWSLLATVPHLHHRRDRLPDIKGMPPDLTKLPAECPFLPRCPKAILTCRTDPAPRLTEVAPGQLAACYNPVYHMPDDSDDRDVAG
jgi:peptide/nickel transport system ATP-binding protein/oligopeptide transport system ATP-binding protein